MKKRIFLLTFLVFVAYAALFNITNVQAAAGKSVKPSPKPVIKVKNITNLKNVILKGDQFSLPNTVKAQMSDGKQKDVIVKWSNTTQSIDKAGTYSFKGKVDGYTKSVEFTLIVNEIIRVDDISSVIAENKEPDLPSTVTVVLSDNTYKEVEVNWDKSNYEKTEPGMLVYYGSINGYDGKLKFTLNRKLPDKIQEIVDKIIKPNMSDYEKELAIHDYLIKNTVYSTEESNYGDDLSDYGVIVDGKGSDYSKAFQRLMGAVGVECKVINGQINFNEDKYDTSWDLVKLENDYYHVDVLLDSFTSNKDKSDISYKYLNLNDIRMSKDHKWDNSTYGACNGTKYWYYAKVEKEINEKVDGILGTIIKPGMTDFDKELAIHDYLIINTVYDKSDSTYEGEFSDYDVIVKGKGYDYDTAFNRILTKVGIECRIINGQVLYEDKWQDSIWNLVKLDGSYYHVDINWDNIRFVTGQRTLSHEYFNRTDKAFKTDHKWNEADYPVCDSENYDITASRAKEVSSKINSILSQIIKPSMSAVEKEIAIHDYVVNSVVYDSEALNNNKNNIIYDDEATNTIYAALIKGKAMCEGYAEAINALLNAAGVEALIISGTAEDSKTGGGPHAWNLVKLDGEYYHLDATWDDPTFENGKQEKSYDYFNLNDKTISIDHKWDASKYPAAASAKYSPANLKLQETDSDGNTIVCINSTDDLYNYLMGETRNNKSVAHVKINSYNSSYDQVLQRVLDDGNARKSTWHYGDNKFGSRYMNLEYTY